MPKGGFIEIGLGTSKGDRSILEASLSRFRKMLASELGIELQSMIHSDKWAIPNGFIERGRGNILLVGDAAGFCNPFSGEGIRLGIESGGAAGQSIADSITEKVGAETKYTIHTKQLERLIKQVYDFSSHLTDKDREDFVRTELSRTRPA